MTIEEFCRIHGGNVRDIASVAQGWQIDSSTAVNATVGSAVQSLIGSTTIVGDAVQGGSLLDQIPTAVQEAFANLMGEKADSIAEMREWLVSSIQAADGSFLSLDDRRVMGLVNKLKGQIGENIFKEQLGSAAQLAASGSQEGWDIAVRQADGAFQYVQVKLYESASAVVQHMRDVQQKLIDGGLAGIDGEPVSDVVFAVPDEIRQDVIRLAGNHGLADMVYETGIPISAEEGASLVREGMTRVGQSRLPAFFGELLCGAVAAGSLHAAVHGFLWYKGSKDFNDAVADTVTDTLISTAGIGVGLIADSLLRSVFMASALGMGTRLAIGHATTARWNFAKFLQQSIAETDVLMARLQAG